MIIYPKQKKLISIGFILAGLILLSSGIASATIIASVPITLTNQQTSNTANVLQVMVTFNAMNTILLPYESNDLGNIRFYNSNAPANPANALYSWCENCGNSIATVKPSNVIFWVRLTNSILANGNTIKLNMTFNSLLTEYDGKYAGEAPQLSVTGYSLASTPITYTSATAFDPTGSGATASPSASTSLYICAGSLNSDSIGYFGSDSMGNSYVSNPPYGDTDEDQDLAGFGTQTGNGCESYSNNPPDPVVTAALSISGMTTYTMTSSPSYGLNGQQTLTFNVNSHNAFVVIAISCGYSACDNTPQAQAAGSTGSMTVPAGCVEQASVDYDGYENSTIYTCNSLTPGSHTARANNDENNGGAEMALGAYVFQNFSSTPVNYAKYDNGPNVFTNYQNFTGTSLPSGWSFEAAYPYYSINYGLQAGTASGQGIGSFSTPINPQALVTEMYGGWMGTGNLCTSCFGLSTSSSSMSGSFLFGDNNGYLAWLHNGGSWYTSSISANPAYQVYGISETPTGTNTVYSYNYNYNIAINSMSSPLYWTFSGLSPAFLYMQWFRTRAMPPNGVMPSVSLGSLEVPSSYTPPTVTISSPSNAIIDVGQYETFNGIITGGTSTYNVNVIVSNVVTSSAIVASSNAVQSSTSWTFSLQSSSAWNTNSPVRANVVVTDSHPTTANSVYTSNIIVNPALVAGAITPASPVLDLGQSVTLASHASGGTTAYSYQWYSNSIGNPGCTTQNAISSATASTYLASPTTSNSYTYKVTDSASTPTTSCSASLLVTVNSALDSTIIPSTAIFDTGQTMTFNTITSGGTPPYHWQWYNDSTGSGILMSGQTGNQLILTAGSAATVKYYDTVTDSASPTPSIIQSNFGTYTIYNSPTSVLSFTNAGGNSISYGTTSIANDIISGGTGTFTWAWTMNGVGISNTAVSSIQTSNTAFLGAGIYVFNIIATDTGTTTPFILSQETNTLTVGKIGEQVSLSVPSSFVYNGFGGLITANVQTINNQLTGTLYINGASAFTTKTQNSIVSSDTANTYTEVFNTIGNQNYTSNSVTGTFVITKNSTATLIMPSNAYELVPQTFHTSISDVLPLQSITWVFNGVVQNTQSISANGIYNFTTTYNSVGFVDINAIITDTGVTSNTFYSNQIVLYKPYINPVIILPILPSITYQNNDTTLSVQVLNGSFKANTIEWEINGNYLTNKAFNGINYQSYNFPLAGIYSIVMQVCDVNGFCTSNTGTVTALSLTPNAFWHIQSATIQNLTYNASENMRLYFEPYNDTNRIANVTINWGDGSPLYRVQYQKTITGDLYIHPYAYPGYYNISATMCDTLDNCYSQNIGRISDLTPSQKGPLSILKSFFFGGAIPSGNVTLSFLTTPPAALKNLFPANWTNIVESWAIIIIIAVALLWLAWKFFETKLTKAFWHLGSKDKGKI